MYNLEGGVIWTQELKNAFKTGTTYCSVIHNQQEYNESNFLKEAELKDVKYVPNAGFIGQAVSKMLTIKMVNDEESNLNFENANVQFKIGAKYNDIIYYINYGNFIVNEPPENDDTNGTVKFVAYDYMIKFNKSYINRVVYPCKLKDLLLDICSQAGVTLGSTTFQNEDFEVEDNQFEGKQLRDVLQHIAKCAFSWARIGQDNKLYLDFEVNNNIDEIITIDDYKMDAFKKANEYYGPINKVTYADSDIKGQEKSVPDDSSIATYGEKEIIIYDNYFAYNAKKRQELIQAGTALFGLRYMPVQNLELIGLVYLDCTDIIGVQDGAGTTYLTRVFSHIIKYNGAVSDTIETTGESENQKTYANANNSIAQNSRTEIIVDRAKKEITAVVKQVEGQNQKISEVKQTVDELNSKISDIADITTSLESNSARLEFEGINQSEPIRVVIHPVGTNIAKLHPSPSLKPSSNLKIKTRILRFTNTTTQEVWNYEIPDDLLYYDNENYDEFQLDYEAQTCIINKKCKWNSDGTVGLLANERTDEYTFPHIELTDGDYTVQLIQYNSGYIFARMMTKNYYTDQFATRAELNSEISQTVDNINLSVNERLTNYSTTTQMNSAIDVKAESITSTVSQTYSTKSETATAKNEAIDSANASTDEKLQNYSTTEEMNSAITQTAESITSTVSSTYSTKTETTNAINGIEIGARNLLAGSSLYTKTNPYKLTPTAADTYIRLPNIKAYVTKGKKYFLQCETDGLWSTHTSSSSNRNKHCTIWIVSTTGENEQAIALNQSFSGNSNETGRKTWQWTSTITGTIGIRLNVYGAGNQAVNFWNLKIEQGTKATGWTPPDEDYSTTTQMNSAIEQTAESITSTVSSTYSKKTESISQVKVEYALGTSTTTAPTSGWSITAPAWQQGKYMWQRTRSIASDGTESLSNPTCIAGAKGQDGTNGVSISSIAEYYAVSSSNSSAPADSAFKTTMQTMTATNKYLWNYEVITYSNNNTQKTIKRVIGTYGDKGTDGTNGIGIKSVTNKYQVSTSNTTAPTTWKDTPQTMTATNKYLWNYEIITYSDNTTDTSTPAVIGTYGDKGNTGDTGKGVKAVVAQYYLSSSKTSQTGGSWSETQPAYKKDYYYWTRTKITWTDNTTTYTTPILVEEINSLNESVAKLEITTGKISTEVSKKVGKTEFGTYITQNTDSVKLAWNQISEYIQMMIINNNASFAILDSSKKPIAYFDKTGIHFSSNNTAFGEMGVQTVDGNKFIAFSVDGTYGSAINNGMAWGIKTTSDGKFHPIFYIKNFEMGSQSSDSSFGELVLSASNLLLDGIGTGLITGGVKIFGDPTAGGMYFYDVNANKYLLQIYPENTNFGDYGEIVILDNISFYRNSGGSNSFRIGAGNQYCLFSDDGAIRGNYLYIAGNGTFTGYLDVGNNINCDGNVYAQNISDRRLKKNIKDVEDNALDNVKKMKVRSFDWKKDDSHVSYGFIAQELEEIDECYVLKQEIKNDKGEITDYKYYQNEFPIIATLTKAIQEQQAQIEELQKEIKELKGGK